MATINLSISQIKELCRVINNWEMQLSYLCGAVRRDVQKMDSWRDPQYELFKNTTEMTHQQLRIYMDQLMQMRISLQKYAEAQEEIRRGFSSSTSQLRNY